MRRLILLAVSLFLILSTATVFASGSSESGKAGGVITMKKFGLRAVPEKRTEIFQMVEANIEKNLGFKVQFEILGIDDETQLTEKLNLMLAAQELPDVFPVWWNEEIRRQGAARFSLEDVKTYMPDNYRELTKIMQNLGMNETVQWNRFMRDGKVVEIPGCWFGGQFPHFAVWRQDLLDKYGMAVPATMDQVGQAFAAFRRDFPNKYPYAAPGKNLWWQSFSYVFDSTGVQIAHWILKDGKVQWGRVQPESKVAFQILADWYKKGYINPEWPTLDNTTNTQLFMNGDKMLEDWRYDSDLAVPFIPGTAGDLISKVVPGVKISGAIYPQLNPGLKPSLYVWNPFHGGSYAFNRKLEATPDILHKMMQVQNFIEQDEATYLLHQYGIEGKTFDFDPVTKIPALKEQYRTNDAQKQIGIGYWWISTYSYNPIGDTKWANPGMIAARNRYILDPKGIYSQANIRWDIDATSNGTTDKEWQELNTKYGSDLHAKYMTMFFEVITGQKPVSAFDEYVAYFNRNGGSELTAAANRIFLKDWQ